MTNHAGRRVEGKMGRENRKAGRGKELKGESRNDYDCQRPSVKMDESTIKTHMDTYYTY